MIQGHGLKHSLVVGLELVAVAMLMFVTRPTTKSIILIHVLPASLIAAIGMSLAYIPALMLAIPHVKKKKNQNLHREL